MGRPLADLLGLLTGDGFLREAGMGPLRQPGGGEWLMRQFLLQDLREQTIIIIVNSISLDYQTKKLSVKLKSPSALAHWRVL